MKLLPAPAPLSPRRLGNKPRPVMERLAEKISPEPNTGCHLWTGATNNRGYGVINIGGGLVGYAHRLSLESAIGRPLADVEQSCHRCDNPLCVNPEHLFVGTQRDNAQDMVRKGRARGWPKGKPFPREVVERRTRTRMARAAQ